MKNLLLLFCLLLSGFSYSQDLVIKKDGVKLYGKILSVKNDTLNLRSKNFDRKIPLILVSSIYYDFNSQQSKSRNNSLKINVRPNAYAGAFSIAVGPSKFFDLYNYPELRDQEKHLSELKWGTVISMDYSFFINKQVSFGLKYFHGVSKASSIVENQFKNDVAMLNTVYRKNYFGLQSKVYVLPIKQSKYNHYFQFGYGFIHSKIKDEIAEDQRTENDEKVALDFGTGFSYQLNESFSVGAKFEYLMTPKEDDHFYVGEGYLASRGININYGLVLNYNF